MADEGRWRNARWGGHAGRGLVDDDAGCRHSSDPALGGSTCTVLHCTLKPAWVNLNLVETRTFPGGVVLTRYETRR